MSLVTTGTLLVLTPLSGATALVLAPYSARGLTMTLEQFGGGGAFIRETIDGETVNLTPPWMKKYQGTITCTDVNAPCLDGAWRGEIVQMDCCIELSYPTGGTPQRPVVSGSSHEEEHVTFYRPSIIAMITDIRDSFAEWRAAYQWQVDFREVRAP